MTIVGRFCRLLRRQRLTNALLGHLIGQCLRTCRGSRKTLLLSQRCSLRAFLLVSQTSESGLTELSPGGLAGESDVEAAAAKPQEDGSGGRSAGGLLAGASSLLGKELLATSCLLSSASGLLVKEL